LSEVTTTSNALVRYSPGGDGRWRGFAAVRRDGGVEVAIGSSARYQRGSGPVVYRLHVLVHVVRVVIETQSRLLDRLAGNGSGDLVAPPFELVVAVAGAQAALLGSLNDGWAEPDQAFDPPQALEQNLLVRVQVQQWPQDDDAREQLLSRATDRLCEAFGHRNRPTCPVKVRQQPAGCCRLTAESKPSRRKAPIDEGVHLLGPQRSGSGT